MKIISFLLFTIISAQLHLLNKLKQTSFGQSIEQTLLLQLQQDESKQNHHKFRVKQILLDIEGALIDEQKQDDLNFQQEYDNCNKMDLTKEIQHITYEQSQLSQRIKQLNSSYEMVVIKQKEKELDFVQKELNQTIIQLTLETNKTNSQLHECDELLQLLQNLRFQFEKRVFSTQNSQKKNEILTQLHQDIKDYFKSIRKLIQKQSFNSFLQVLVESFEQQSNNYEKYKLITNRSYKMIIDISEIIQKNKDQIRIQHDKIMENIKINMNYYQANLQALQSEIASIKQTQKAIEIEYAQLSLIFDNLQQTLIGKMQQQNDKELMCTTLASDYKDYRDFRDSQRKQVSDLIGIVERDIFAVKDHYIINGLLRQ